MIVRESISFKRYKDPKTALFGERFLPGQLVKYSYLIYIFNEIFDDLKSSIYFTHIGKITRDNFSFKEIKTYPIRPEHVDDVMENTKKLNDQEIQIVKPEILKHKDEIENICGVKIRI